MYKHMKGFVPEHWNITNIPLTPYPDEIHKTRDTTHCSLLIYIGLRKLLLIIIIFLILEILGMVYSLNLEFKLLHGLTCLSCFKKLLF